MQLKILAHNLSLYRQLVISSQGKDIHCRNLSFSGLCSKERDNVSKLDWTKMAVDMDGKLVLTQLIKMVLRYNISEKLLSELFTVTHILFIAGDRCYFS